MGRILSIVIVVAAAAGLLFSAVSTADFMAHLDRQVHGIHCSLLPGISAPDASGASGCHAALMSPYSSVLRDRYWGGIPVSLPGMSLFAYVALLGLATVLGKRTADVRAAAFLLLVAAVPVVTSLVMGYLAATRVGAICETCVGIYGASGLAFAAALAAWIRAFRRGTRKAPAAEPGEPAETGEPRKQPAGESPRPLGLGAFALWSALGLVFVALPLAVYVALAPDFGRFVGSCGTLPRPAAPPGVLVPLGRQAPGSESVEVLDPLCPACRAFDRRLRLSGLEGRLRRRALLFPLDGTCNWMVHEAIHPGACALSEAVLCAGDRGDEVLAWAFDEQDELRRRAAEDPEAPGRVVRERFPDIADCVGSATVRARLNRGLRWAVDNQLPVLSPQLYVEGAKLCDEDTDLGLDFMLGRLLDRVGTRGRGTAREARAGGEP